jgi:hypothetical protein
VCVCVCLRERVCVYSICNRKKNTVFATATAGGVSLGPGSGRGYLRSLSASGFGMIAPICRVVYVDVDEYLYMYVYVYVNVYVFVDVYANIYAP